MDDDYDGVMVLDWDVLFKSVDMVLSIYLLLDEDLAKFFFEIVVIVEFKFFVDVEIIDRFRGYKFKVFSFDMILWIILV